MRIEERQPQAPGLLYYIFPFPVSFYLNDFGPRVWAKQHSLYFLRAGLENYVVLDQIMHDLIYRQILGHAVIIMIILCEYISSYIIKIFNI